MNVAATLNRHEGEKHLTRYSNYGVQAYILIERLRAETRQIQVLVYLISEIVKKMLLMTCNGFPVY